MPAAVRVKLGWLSLPKQNDQALKQGVYVKGQDCVCVAQGGRCNDFLQNQKMVDDCVAGKGHEGWRVGAKKSNFQFPSFLVRGSLPATMWFQTFFDAIW